MGRLIIRSFFEDIKNFKNMVPYRAKKIEEAAAEPLPENYGVNELSAVLHPDKQKAVLTSAVTVDSNIKIVTLSPYDNANFARFRAGQGINIKVGSETTFFPMLSAPDEKDYSIVVYSDYSDAVSEFLFKADLNTEIEISGPTGLFYFSELRDGSSVVLICDIFGVAPVLSVCRYLRNSENTAVKVLIIDEDENSKFFGLFDNMPANISVSCVKNEKETYGKVTSEIKFPSAFLVSGKHDFCGRIKTLFDKFEFLRGRVRLYVSDPPETVSEVTADKYNCQVLYRNETFSFDCFANETILSAFERNHIPTQAKCKVGECGYCRCKLLDGRVEYITCNDIDSRRSADEKYGFIHPCRAFPKTNIKVKL